MSHANSTVLGLPDCRENAKLLVDKQLVSIARYTDRMFALLMGLQWVAALAAALCYSPRSWAGGQSSTHIHVWAAVFLVAQWPAFPSTSPPDSQEVL